MKTSLCYKTSAHEYFFFTVSPVFTKSKNENFLIFFFTFVSNNTQSENELLKLQRRKCLGMKIVVALSRLSNTHHNFTFRRPSDGMFFVTAMKKGECEM
jgi:hypothetical protein